MAESDDAAIAILSQTIVIIQCSQCAADWPDGQTRCPHCLSMSSEKIERKPFPDLPWKEPPVNAG